MEDRLTKIDAELESIASRVSEDLAQRLDEAREAIGEVIEKLKY